MLPIRRGRSLVAWPPKEAVTVAVRVPCGVMVARADVRASLSIRRGRPMTAWRPRVWTPPTAPPWKLAQRQRGLITDSTGTTKGGVTA